MIFSIHGSCAAIYFPGGIYLNAVELGSLRHPQSRTWNPNLMQSVSNWDVMSCHQMVCRGVAFISRAFEVSQIVKFTLINARLQVIGRMMMEKLPFQERIPIHRPCFWWIWSLVVLSILVRWRQDLPVKMWRRWLTNGTRENSKKNLTWKGRHYAESEADIAGIALRSWHYAFTANFNLNIKNDSH